MNTENTATDEAQALRAIADELAAKYPQYSREIIIQKIYEYFPNPATGTLEESIKYRAFGNGKLTPNLADRDGFRSQKVATLETLRNSVLAQAQYHTDYKETKAKIRREELIEEARELGLIVSEPKGGVQ